MNKKNEKSENNIISDNTAFSYDTESAALACQLTDAHELTLLSVREKHAKVSIPNSIYDYNITSIAPKAFLGQKGIEELSLPSGITSVGDWGLSHMSELKKLILPDSLNFLGRQVFLECKKLSSVKFNGNETESDILLAPLFAACVTSLKEPQLLLTYLSENRDTASWLKSFDGRLNSFFMEKDDVGFTPVFLGWFEDEDVYGSQLPRYIREKQYQKLSLAIHRAAFSDYPLETCFTYISEHAAALPDYLTDCCVNDLASFMLLTEHSLLSLEQLDSMINKQAFSPEITAHLLSVRDSKGSGESFFDDLSL